MLDSDGVSGPRPMSDTFVNSDMRTFLKPFSNLFQAPLELGLRGTSCNFHAFRQCYTKYEIHHRFLYCTGLAKETTWQLCWLAECFGCSGAAAHRL